MNAVQFFLVGPDPEKFVKFVNHFCIYRNNYPVWWNVLSGQPGDRWAQSLFNRLMIARLKLFRNQTLWLWIYR